jgi:hypothetical protein
MIHLFIKTFFFILFLIGCSKPNPNPHLTDYIYQNINEKLAESEKIKDTYKTNYEDLIGKLKNIDQQSREHWLLYNKSFRAKWETEKAQQKIDYYKMLLFEREKFVRESYLKAFSKGEKWDNTEEVKKYKNSANWEDSLSKQFKTKKNATNSKQTEGGESESSSSSPTEQSSE